MTGCTSCLNGKWFRLIWSVWIVALCATMCCADVSVPEYDPDGVIRTTNARLEMSSGGVIQLYDKNNVRHDIHLAMDYQAGGWLTPSSLPDLQISCNPQTRTTTCSGTLYPPAGSVDTTPIPMQFWMRLMDNGKVRIGAAFDTPLAINDILSGCHIKDHVRPRTAFIGHDVVADGTPYLISDNNPVLGTVVLESQPIDQISLLDDIADQKVQFELVASKNEYLIDRDLSSNAHIETKFSMPNGYENLMAWDVIMPEETPALAVATPTFLSDGRIICGSASMVLYSNGQEIKLVDSNGITYSIHMSMGLINGPGWFTMSYSQYVTDGQFTVDTTNKKTSYSGKIQLPGSGEMPVTFYMQLLSNNKIRVGADFTRSGSIYDVMSSCYMKAHIRPHDAFVGHVIDAGGTEFPIIAQPPVSSGVILKSGSIPYTHFMKDSPLQMISFEPIMSDYDYLVDYNTTSPLFDLRCKASASTNSVSWDITLPPTDTNPSEEAYGGIDFWKSNVLRLPEYDTSPNLISNPSFEHGLNYWQWSTQGSATQSPVSRYYQADDSESYDGNASLRITGKQGQAPGLLSTFAIPVESGETYTLSFYAKGSSSAAKLWMSGYTSKHGVWIPNIPSSLSLTTSWQRYTYTFTVPNSIASIGMTMNSPTSDCYAWVDCMQLEKASSASNFTQRPYSMSLVTDEDNNLFEPGDNPNASVKIVGNPNTSGQLTVYLQDFTGKEYQVQQDYFNLSSNGQTIITQNWDTNLDRGLYVVKMVATVSSTDYQDFDRIAIMPFATTSTPGRQLFALHGGATDQLGEWDRQYDYFTKMGVGSSIFFDPTDAGVYSVLSNYNFTNLSSILEGGHRADSLSIDLKDDFDLTSQELSDLQTYAYNKAQANPQITHWKLVNEPNTSQNSQAELDNMIDAMGALAAGIKQANANAKVMTNDPSNMHPSTGIHYIDKLLENGAGSICDIVAIHPYRNQPESPDLDADIVTLMSMLSDNSFTGDVWFTEGVYYNNYILPNLGLNTHVGCSTDNFRAGDFSYDMGWGERMSAAYTARSFLAAMKYGDRVKLFVDWGMATNSMLDYDLTATSATFAVNTLVRTLGAATYEGQPDIATGVRCYVFTDTQGNRVAAVWAYGFETDSGNKNAGYLDASSLHAVYSTSDMELIDFMGQTSEVADSIKLYPWPTFIRVDTGSASTLISAMDQTTYSGSE